MDYNYAALTKEVTPEDIRAYQAVAHPKTNDTITKVFKIIGIVLLAGIILATLVSIFFAVGQGGSGAWGPAVTFMITTTVIIGIAVAVYFGSKMENRRRVRLSWFAADNGLIYQPAVTGIAHAGMFFQLGHSRRVTHSLTGQLPKGGNFQFADYNYTTGSGKNQQTHTMSFIRIQLERNLPHMVLDSMKNNMKLFGANMSNLPVSFQKDQVLTLEGNFNDYFKLYAPKEYERDALYVFTPDLMALFMDTIAVNDAEIVDDQLYVYSSSTIAYENPAVVQNIMKIIEVVGGKTIRRTDRYSDERATTADVGMVAAPARRLKRGGSVFAIIFTVAIILYVIYSFVQP